MSPPAACSLAGAVLEITGRELGGQLGDAAHKLAEGRAGMQEARRALVRVMQEPTTKLDPEPTAERLTVEVRRLALSVLQRYLDRNAPEWCNLTQVDFALRTLSLLGCEEPPVWVFGGEGTCEERERRPGGQ